MTAIFGRLATYTGEELDCDKAINSNVSLADVDAFENMASTAPVQLKADGKYPIPVPGKGAKEFIDF